MNIELDKLAVYDINECKRVFKRALKKNSIDDDNCRFIAAIMLSLLTRLSDLDDLEREMFNKLIKTLIIQESVD